MTFQRALSALALLALAGCSTYELGTEWRPLRVVVERPSLPYSSDLATTTVGSRVYTVDLDQWLKDYPPGSIEFEALLLHEREHARRQFAYKGYPKEVALAAWIARYLSDLEFRWEEEQAGFYQAIRHLAKHGAWSRDRALLRAHSLAEAYSNGDKPMVSYEEALEWIEQVVAGTWEPPR